MEGQVKGQSLMGRFLCVLEVVQEEIWVWMLAENLSATGRTAGWTDRWTQMLKLAVLSVLRSSEGR